MGHSKGGKWVQARLPGVGQRWRRVALGWSSAYLNTRRQFCCHLDRVSKNFYNIFLVLELFIFFKKSITLSSLSPLAYQICGLSLNEDISLMKGIKLGIEKTNNCTSRVKYLGIAFIKEVDITFKMIMFLNFV